MSGFGLRIISAEGNFPTAAACISALLMIIALRGSVAIRRYGIMFGAKTRSLPDETEPDASLSARV
jgi:hypothetical protein